MSEITPAAPVEGSGRELDSEDVTARLAWLESATTEDEARLIESALIVQTDNRPHQGDPEEQPE
jgi:hypothetical protein